MLQQTQNSKHDIEQISISNIVEKIKGFVQRTQINKEALHEVLNAFPGHGKTTALKFFLKEIIETKNRTVGALVVLREKEQLREFEAFVGSDYALYVDSENLYSVSEEIPSAQIVIITHERLKNITLLNQWPDHYTTWNSSKRIIFIDEAPIFSKSHTFKLNDNLTWLDDCFKALSSHISAAEIVIIRSLIQIALAKELLENDGLKTRALKRHIDSKVYLREINRFLQLCSNNLNKISSIDSINAFLFFKQLFNQDGIGFVDPALHSHNHLNHKNIICSDRIDYRTLGCSILIFDGTAVCSSALYANEYKQPKEIQNEIDYKRLHLYHRIIKTTASRRKEKSKLSVHRIIATDLTNIALEKGYKPFPLMNKNEIPIYKDLGVIDELTYNQYFEKIRNGKNPINLLNTVGKNYLREQSSLYLVSLPNRPPEYYKAIAISLYKNDAQTLNISTAHKDKTSIKNWFADDRIENIYHEMLLSELNQIIHRTSIRNIGSIEPVHIYIATHSVAIIQQLRTMFTGHHFDDSLLENHLTFESDASQKAAYLASRMSIKDIFKPTAIGRIEEKHDVKNFINKNWKDPVKQKIIKRVFAQHNIAFHELENGEKRVFWMSSL